MPSQVLLQQWTKIYLGNGKELNDKESYRGSLFLNVRRGYIKKRKRELLCGEDGLKRDDLFLRVEARIGKYCPLF